MYVSNIFKCCVQCSYGYYSLLSVFLDSNCFDIVRQTWMTQSILAISLRAYLRNLIWASVLT